MNRGNPHTSPMTLAYLFIPTTAYSTDTTERCPVEAIDITLAERRQIVIPKAALDALGLKAGARLQIRLEAGRLVIEKKVLLNLKRWVGHAEDDGLSSAQTLSELCGRPVPWQNDASTPKPNAGGANF